MRHPFVGEPSTFKDLIHTSWRDLFPGWRYSWSFISSDLGRILLGNRHLRFLLGSVEDRFRGGVCVVNEFEE